MGSSDEAVKAGARVIQSCELVFAKVAKRKHAEYLSERSQHMKVRDALMRGKFEAATAKVLCVPLAKCVAASLEASGPHASLPISIDAEPSHRDWRCVAAWTQMPADILAIYDGCKTSIEAKVKKHDEKLMTNASSWLGAQSKVDFEAKKHGDVELKLGLGPFVVTILKDAPRFGPAATPLPDVGRALRAPHMRLVLRGVLRH